eukprot:scaffold6649_cov147-Skeletonema_dohrnii-CCMP3373.AAC.1
MEKKSAKLEKSLPPSDVALWAWAMHRSLHPAASVLGTIERQERQVFHQRWDLFAFCASPQNNVGISTLSSTTPTSYVFSFTTLSHSSGNPADHE